MPPTNAFGQEIGESLGDWTPPLEIAHDPLSGAYVNMTPLEPGSSGDLFRSLRDEPESLWTYMPFGPFDSEADLERTITWMGQQPDWLPYLISVEDQPEGFCSYLRVDLPNGAVEIGSIFFSSRLRRTRAATESMYLMMRHAFSSGFRRVEWKCDALNAPSRRAGQRLGFRYEGTFHNATHYKGRNRDTAWFAARSEDWPPLEMAFRGWLDPANFAADGSQRKPLETFRPEVL